MCACRERVLATVEETCPAIPNPLIIPFSWCRDFRITFFTIQFPREEYDKCSPI